MLVVTTPYCILSFVTCQTFILYVKSRLYILYSCCILSDSLPKWMSLSSNLPLSYLATLMLMWLSGLYMEYTTSLFYSAFTSLGCSLMYTDLANVHIYSQHWYICNLWTSLRCSWPFKGVASEVHGDIPLAADWSSYILGVSGLWVPGQRLRTISKICFPTYHSSVFNTETVELVIVDTAGLFFNVVSRRLEHLKLKIFC